MNSDMNNLISNLQTNVSNLMQHHSNISNNIFYKKYQNSEDKFLIITNLLETLQNEIIDIKKDQLNNSKYINNDIQDEVNNLKLLIHNNNDISMIENTENYDYILNEINNLKNNKNIIKVIQDVEYLQSIIVQDKTIKRDIDLIQRKLEIIEFNMIEYDFKQDKSNEMNKIKLRDDEIINIRSMIYSNDKIYQCINQDLNDVKNSFISHKIDNNNSYKDLKNIIDDYVKKGNDVIELNDIVSELQTEIRNDQLMNMETQNEIIDKFKILEINLNKKDDQIINLNKLVLSLQDDQVKLKAAMKLLMCKIK